jgi:hypothetical protein
MEVYVTMSRKVSEVRLQVGRAKPSLTKASAAAIPSDQLLFSTQPVDITPLSSPHTPPSPCAETTNERYIGECRYALWHGSSVACRRALSISRSSQSSPITSHFSHPSLTILPPS